MDRRLAILNVVFAITDTFVCALGIVCFGLAAYFFGKWWIVCFNLFPLLLYHSHTLVIDNDIHTQCGGDIEGGEEDG